MVYTAAKSLHNITYTTVFLCICDNRAYDHPNLSHVLWATFVSFFFDLSVKTCVLGAQKESDLLIETI